MKWYRSKWFIVLIAVIVCAGGTYAYFTKGKKSKAADVKEVTYEVKKGIFVLPYQVPHSSNPKIHKQSRFLLIRI